MERKSKNNLTHYAILFCGAAILSFGLFNIHSRSRITEGGVLGTVLLINHWLGISPGITNPILDMCCYLLGWRMLGNSFLKNAIFASLSFSACYNIWETIGYVLPDMSSTPLLAAITGAIFVGVGVGIVVKKGGACGGDDALAMVISKVTGWRIAQAYIITDITVLILSLSYIPFGKIIYSLLTVTLSSRIIDKIQYFDF
ncbi:MAG: YitT family protein [Oscillospiraceae bacterium]|nr:YitT family protein [Oscillospiraceae bacterium]